MLAHPRGVVPEIRVDCLQSGRIFFLALLTFVFLQNVCQRRQLLFDRLLAAYGILQRKVADLRRTKEVQDTRLAELEGMPPLILSVRHLPG